MAKDAFIIEGTAYYPFLMKPRKNENGNDKYEITVANLSDKHKNMLKKAGLKPKFEPDEDNYRHEWGWYIVLKNGFKPKVVDSNKRPLPESVLVGNGSKVRVKLDTYDYTYNKIDKVGANLLVVQVLELQRYVSEKKFENGEVPEEMLSDMPTGDGFSVDDLEDDESEEKPAKKSSNKTKKTTEKLVEEDLNDDLDF